MSHVKLEVEVVVDDPIRMVDAERHLEQFLVQRLYPAGERCKTLKHHGIGVERRCRPLVDGEARNMTKRR